MSLNQVPESQAIAESEGQALQERLCQLIQDSAMFQDLEWDDITQLAGYMKLYRVGKDKLIFREGERGDYLCLVLEGKVSVVKEKESGTYTTMYMVHPGRMVGEMSIVDGGPRSATCVARDESILAILRRPNFMALVDTHPRLGAKILFKLANMLSQRLRRTSGLLVDHMGDASQ